MFGKNKKKLDDKDIQTENNNIEDIVKDKLLYIVTDRYTPQLLDYARECGLNVTNIYDSIDIIRDIRLMQFEPARIVIIDSGTGKFVTPTIRKDLVDLVGMNDADNCFTVFYTDTLIKSSAQSEVGKDSEFIEWFKYNNTVSCIATVLNHKNENYVFDKDTYGESRLSAENILNSFGKETPGVELETLSKLSISPASIKSNNELDYEKIRGFTIKL